MSTELIPFQIEAERVIQLFATQIYQSPLALLRENTQNAFDAIRLRLHRDPTFEPRIDVDLTEDRVIISDNGIGMTADDLRQHYWKAGSSSKNNDEARAAGVVGTFGIGAMASFGIADRLIVETESAISGERTVSRAEKSKLSLREDCIELERVAPTGAFGTKVIAEVAAKSRINVQQARSYIAEFVALVDVPVFVNGALVSQKPVEAAVPAVPETWRHNANSEKIGARLQADITLVTSNNADIWMKLTNISWSDRAISGRVVLRSGLSALRTFRSGFGLATASANSTYQFGGVADLLILEPTAGREALTVDGIQLLQAMMNEIDAYVSTKLSGLAECDVSTPFMSWVTAHDRWDLCRRLRMTIVPGDKIDLGEVERRSKDKPMMLYEGNDQGIITLHATEETPLLVLARSNPRRQCEQTFINQNCKVDRISNNPVVKNRRRSDQLTIPESGLCYRVESILDFDYFLKTDVSFGSISHGLPVLAEKIDDNRVSITLNPEAQAVHLLLSLYDSEFSAFGSMAKDFVRTVIFPRVADFVPSSTRQGAEAFLKAIRKSREVFEYADDDLGALPKIWGDYHEGLITVEQAVEQSKRAARASVQIVDGTTSVREVVPDVIQNEQALQDTALNGPNNDPAPAITRLEAESSAKLLIIDDSEPALRGYRCFLAITDKVREERGEFFLQPHRTSVVWGGQKTLFIFLHHSGQFGLYYDLQTGEPVDAAAGGGPYPTSTIVLKNRIFIPIPDVIRSSFIPRTGERKRFEIRADILRTEASKL
jgi:molecular chaperone HtpG